MKAKDKNSEHFIKRMNPKIYKHLGGTDTSWREHKSSQAIVLSNFQLFHCRFGTSKPHRGTIKVRAICFKYKKKRLKNFLNNKFTLAYNFIICLFKSTLQ